MGLVFFSSAPWPGKWFEAELNTITLLQVEQGRRLILVMLDDQAPLPALLKRYARRGAGDFEQIVDAILGHSRKPPLGAAATQPKRLQFTLRLARGPADAIGIEALQDGQCVARQDGVVIRPALRLCFDEFVRGQLKDAPDPATPDVPALRPHDLPGLGDQLGRALCPGDVGVALAQALQAVNAHCTLDLCFESADPALLALPFETLRIGKHTPALMPGVSVRRRVAGAPAQSLALARQHLEQARQQALQGGAPADQQQAEYATASLYGAGDDAPLVDFAAPRQPLSVAPVHQAVGPMPDLRLSNLLQQVPLLLVLGGCRAWGRAFLDDTVRVLTGLLAARAHSGRLLITCRHPLPALADEFHPLPLGPLSPAEVRKLLWRLESLKGLDRADVAEEMHHVGGHQRMLEFLDGLLRHGAARLPEVKRRLREAAQAAGIAPNARPADLSEALRNTALLGARTVFLDELLALARAQGDEEPLRQLAVSALPMSAADLARTLAGAAAAPVSPAWRAATVKASPTTTSVKPPTTSWPPPSSIAPAAWPCRLPTSTSSGSKPSPPWPGPATCCSACRAPPRTGRHWLTSRYRAAVNWA